MRLGGRDWQVWGPCNDLRWSLDGAVVVAAGRRISCSEASSGATTHTEPVKEALLGESLVAWRPADAPGTLVIATLPDLTEVRRVEVGLRAQGLAWGPDGDVLVWRAHSYLAVSADPAVPPRSVELQMAPCQLATSPDGVLVAAGITNGWVVRVDHAAGQLVGKPLKGLRRPPTGLVWSSDGQHLLGSASGSALAWPAGGGKAKRLWRAKHIAHVVGASGGVAVVVGQREAIVGIDLATGDERWRYEHYGPVTLEGTSVLHAEMATVRRIDIATGQVLASVTAPDIHVDAAASHGERVATVQSGVHRVRHGPLAGPFAPLPAAPTGHLRCHHLGADGTQLITGHDSGQAFVWQVQPPAPSPVRALDHGTSDDTTAVCLVDADTLFTATTTVVHRWTAAGRVASSERLPWDVTALVPLPDGGVLAAVVPRKRAHGHLVRLDAELAIVGQAPFDHVVRAGALDDAGRVVLRGDASVRVVDLATLTLVDRRDVHSDDLARHSLVDAAFTRHVQTDSRPEVARGPWFGWLWSQRLSDGQLTAERVRTEQLTGRAALSPSGHRLATPHADGVRCWEAETLTLVTHDETVRGALALVWLTDSELLVAHRGGGLELLRSRG